MRIILYTGKGGVGKTCVAAATALHLADAGRRVLVASTDAAHSLGDALDVAVGSAPVRVAPNVDALEIDPAVAGRAAWGGLQAYLRTLMTSHADAGIEADEHGRWKPASRYQRHRSLGFQVSQHGLLLYSPGSHSLLPRS